MATIAIIVDHRPEYLARGPGSMSLLTLPLGTGHLLDAFVRLARSAGAGDLVAMPTFDFEKSYDQRISLLSSGSVAVCPPSEQRALLEKYEGGDSVLVFDARYFSGTGFNLRDLLESSRQQRTVAYAVSVRPEQGNTAERIVFASNGGIKRIRRLYDKISWSHKPHSVVLFAVMPHQLAEAVPIYPMDESRVWLVKQGIPAHECATTGHVFDLFDPVEFLEMNRRQVIAEVEAEEPPKGYLRPRPGLLVAKGVEIPESTRIMGPVVIKRAAEIAAGGTLIGPCVIGEGVRLDEGVLVARSVLPDGVCVPLASNVVNALGVQNGNGSQESAPMEMRFSAARGRLPMTDDELQCMQGDRGLSLPSRGGRGLYPAVKRAMDLVGSILGILATLPLLPIVALILKLDSKGPVFFAHWREGRGGKEFPCYKFRTMRTGAHDEQRALYAKNQVDGPQFNMSNDPRITAVGRWLRAMNIDELPQLFNVFLGHMSLVGPRPSPFRENQVCLPWRRARLAVRPGIAGLWQICRHDRGEGDFSQWICYDVAYVRYMSLWLDVKILFHCVISMGGRRPVPLSKLLPEESHHDLPSPIIEILHINS